MTTKTSTVGRNAAADALCALAASGYIRLYDGTRPANPQTPVSTQVKLAELRFGSTAFGSAATGVATANAITSDSSADAGGTASWFRVLKSDGTTVLWDGDVTATGGGGEMQIATVTIVAAAVIACTALTLTIPE